MEGGFQSTVPCLTKRAEIVICSTRKANYGCEIAQLNHGHCHARRSYRAPGSKCSKSRVRTWLMKITRCTASGLYAINTSSKTWNAAHSPRLTPQAQIVAFSCVSGRP